MSAPAFIIPFFWDPTFLLLIPAMLLALWAQGLVSSAYRRYSQVPARSGATGRDVAADLLMKGGLAGVPVQPTQGRLDDHYDPRKRTVNLSPGVYQGRSLAALAVAAHETGHAMQHAEGWLPLTLRNVMAPTVGFGSGLAFPLFLVGFLFASFRVLMDVGILLFSLAVLFHLVTLPVELDASRRAMAMLEGGGYLTVDESRGARRMLRAAAMTYVAAAAVAVMSLLRLLILRGARR
ncbi:MAG: zinc metallopeptidase [Candidatus Krumholzibacteriota bacterium]|nr:zinc metallopeptidase [Candidatus Krumholzibacteriota bacterium]